jgi:hypothetical protein
VSNLLYKIILTRTQGRFYFLRGVCEPSKIETLVLSCLSVLPSVRMERLGIHWTDFHEIWYLNIFRKSIEFHSNRTKITGTLHEDQYTFLIVFRTVLLRMRNISDKNWRENQTHITHIFNNDFPENRAIYGIKWKNVVQLDRPQTIWCICIAYWIPKATNTLSEYVIIMAFPQQTMLAPTHLIVTSYLKCYVIPKIPVLLIFLK